MKKVLMKTACLLTMLAMMFGLSACTASEAQSEDKTAAVCSNGTFVGFEEEETGVLSFKGIPYAKAPVGELRWRAPEAAEDSDQVIEAKEFGKTSIQYAWHSEPVQTEFSEDCLTLNVWTKDLSGEKKPVMVFFHGGSFAWGGTSEALYNGQYIVNEHDDVIVVTCNYRVGMMGFINLSGIEGGEDYTDSEQLGLLDAIESLRWIQKNIAAFGGDPENVTVFGESAGSTMVACLLASDQTEGLFQRAICESGSMNLTMSQEDYDASVQGEALLQASGCKNMEELLALSEEELIAANELELDEDENTVNDFYSLPLRGGIVPEDPYEAIEKGHAKGIDLMIGTNTDEISYWVAEMGEEPMTEMDEEGVQENLAVYQEYFIDPLYESIVERVSEEDAAKIQEYMTLKSDKEELWARSALITEALFRQPSIAVAQSHAASEGEGKTYMYSFGKTNDQFDFMGAGHASELAYVFHNTEETEFSGTVDSQLADKICTAWVNFAKTGDPSSEDTPWSEYTLENRETMVIGDDSSMKMENDPLSKERQLTEPLTKYYLWSAGA